MQAGPRAIKPLEHAVQVSELLQVVQESSNVRQASNKLASKNKRKFTGAEPYIIKSS